MSKSDTFENDLLKMIFNAVAIANIADNAGTAPLTNLYVSLHTADPTDAGTQDASEATYTGYARVAVARTAGGWTVTGSSVSPTANIDFPICSGALDDQTITHWAVGVASSGASKVLYAGSVTPPINVVDGVSPRLTTATAVTED